MHDDASSDSSISSGDNSPSMSGEEAITLALASLDYLSSRDISTSVSGEEAITLALASLDYLSSGIRSSTKIEVKLNTGDAALARQLFRY